MKNLKKVLALVLAFACAFTMFAGAAFTDQADINTDNVEAVDLLTTLGIIKGYEDGSFDPEGTVDRAEMAKMIYTIRNGGNDDASAYESVTTSFTDISGHWAEGYIKYLQNTGIVAGKSATQFDPDSQVTTGEAMKMALALAGYDEVNAGLTGTAWLNNTVSLATTYGLTDDVASAISGGCSRQDAAQILANALGMTAVRYSSIVENFVNDSENGLSWGGDPISVGRKWMDLWTNIGTLLNIDGKELVLKMSDSDKADSDAKNIDTFINLSKDYSDLLGQKVKVLFDSGKNNSVIGVFAIDDNTVVTANQNAIGVDTGKLKIDGTKYTIEDDGVVVYKDGSPEDTNYKAGDFTADQSADVITFIDSDDNDKIDTAYIKTYEVAQVSYASASQIIAGGKTYEADEENIAEGLAKDDWIIITHNLYNTNLDIVKADVVTGTVNATKSKGTAPNTWTQFQIDETWYNETNSSNGDVQSNVKAGVDAEYVALNGILFYAKKVTVSTDHLSDVLFVAYKGSDGLANNQARVMFPNGDEATIDLKNNYVEDQNGNKAGGILNGTVYEYYKSGSKYQLVQLDTTADAYGDYTYMGTSALATLYSKASTAGGLAIDDSADVVVFTSKTNPSADNKTYSIKHITGKQLKEFTVTDNNAAGNGGAKYVMENTLGAFKSDVNGLTRATTLFVSFASDNGSFNGALDNLSSYAHYGFITKDAERVGNDQIKFNVWTGTEDLEVYADQTNETKFTKGTVIGYDSITAEDGKNIIDDIFPMTMTASSITSARNDGKKFNVQGISGELDVDDFSAVLYVNTSDNETIGIADGKATAAHDPLKDGMTLATNILYNTREVAVIDVNEIAGESYANNILSDDTADSTYYVNEISDFSSVQWLNNRTGDTDNTKAYANAQMTLSFYSEKAGTLKLNGVKDAKGNPVSLTVVAGTNEFEDLYVTGDVTVADWDGTGSGVTGNIEFGTIDMLASKSDSVTFTVSGLPTSTANLTTNSLIRVTGVSSSDSSHINLTSFGSGESQSVTISTDSTGITPGTYTIEILANGAQGTATFVVGQAGQTSAANASGSATGVTASDFKITTTEAVYAKDASVTAKVEYTGTDVTLSKSVTITLTPTHLTPATAAKVIFPAGALKNGDFQTVTFAGKASGTNDAIAVSGTAADTKAAAPVISNVTKGATAGKFNIQLDKAVQTNVGTATVYAPDGTHAATSFGTTRLTDVGSFLYTMDLSSNAKMVPGAKVVISAIAASDSDPIADYTFYVGADYGVVAADTAFVNVVLKGTQGTDTITFKLGNGTMDQAITVADNTEVTVKVPVGTKITVTQSASTDTYKANYTGMTSTVTSGSAISQSNAANVFEVTGAGTLTIAA